MKLLFVMAGSLLLTIFLVLTLIKVLRKEVKVRKGGEIFLILLIGFCLFAFGLTFYQYFLQG
ncbi:MAG: hypothetical protein MJB14_05315 [Spirochaetes bacterium]|nr:hypothetical protein [Spirochaetota bacterium]